MSEDFRVNLETLGQVSRGVRDAVGELTAMGDWGSELSASRGQGLTYALSNLDTGHEALADAAESSGEAWDFGLRHLVKDGVSAADRIDEAAAEYRAMERDNAERLSQVLSGGEARGQQ